jgi:hypothetical protein
MKEIILAGDSGTRLSPVNLALARHLGKSEYGRYLERLPEYELRLQCRVPTDLLATRDNLSFCRRVGGDEL